MKMYWRVRPWNSARSVSMWSGVKAIQLTTASKMWPSRAGRTLIRVADVTVENGGLSRNGARTSGRG